METIASIIRRESYPGIIFVREIDKGRKLAADLEQELGITVPFVWGGMPRKDRNVLANKMRARDPGVRFVVATRVWGTGIDIKPIRWVMRLGAGTSVIALEQEAGRGSRVADGKDGVTYYDIANDTPCSSKNAAVRDFVWEAKGYNCSGSGGRAIGQTNVGDATTRADSDTNDFELTSLLLDESVGSGSDQFNLASVVETKNMKPKCLGDVIILVLELFVVTMGILYWCS